MLLPFHLLQPELQRKQCVKVHWCVSSDIRPGLERQLKPLGQQFEPCKNQTRTLSFHIECISPQDPHRWHCTWDTRLIVSFFIIFLYNKGKHSHLLQSFLFDRLFIWLLWGAPRDLKLFNLKLMFSKAITEFWIIIWGPYGLLRKVFLQCVAISCRWKLKWLG